MAKGLSRSGYQVHFGCFQPEGILKEDLLAAGPKLVELPVRSLSSPATVRAGWNLARYLRRHRIDVVHAFDNPTGVFVVPAARLARVRVVLASQRGYRTTRPPALQKLLRWTDPLVHAFVVNCRAMEHHLVDDEGIAPARIHLCYNGLDTARFSAGIGEPVEGFPSDSLVIGTICRFRPEKDLRTLINAFSRVRSKYSHARLVLIGGGPLQGDVARWIAETGFAEDCRVLPETREVVPWLRRMHIFVLPSLSEAFSNSIMEAMACGATVVASNTGGNPELVRHEETGLLFEPGSVEGLASQLERLAVDAPLRHRLAATGSGFVSENLSLAAMTRRMAAIYDSLLSR